MQAIKIPKSMLISVLAAVLLLGTIYIGVRFHIQQKPIRQAIAPSIVGFKVEAKDYQPIIEAIGTLQANQGTVLKAQADGQVESVNFSPGEAVQKGNVLVTLNNVQQLGALDAAIAQAKLNVAMYQRDLELKEIGAISLAAVDQAKAALDAGEAAVHEAQGVYDLTIVKAPFSGRVGIVKINLGDYLQAADPIVSLQNLDPMFVDFYVPEKYFPSIKKGEIVNVIANTLPRQVFTGKIVSYETVVDQTTGMLQVRASVSNPQEVLLPGGYVTVSVHVGALQKTLSIPQTALMYDTDSAYVYLVQENKAVRQNVKLGEQIKQEIQITEGLKPGDIIVSVGTNKVQSNGSVQVIFESDAL